MWRPKSDTEDFVAGVPTSMHSGRERDGLALRGEPAVLVELPPAARFSIWRRQGAWRDALRRRVLALADVFSLTAAAAILSGTGGPAVLWSLASLPIWLVLAKLYGLYDNDHRVLRHLTVDELPSLFAWLTTGTATCLLLLSLSRQESVTPGTAARLWVTLVVLVPVARALGRAIWRRVTPPERAVIVGSGPLEAATRRKLDLFHDIHVECVGVIDDRRLSAGTGTEPLRGLTAALAGALPADRLIVASDVVTEPLIATLVKLCRYAGLKLSVVPPARGMFGTAVSLNHIADLPMIEYSTWDIARSSELIKRVLDIVISSVALVLLGPLLVLVALIVRLDSKGSPIFVQTRAGRLGAPFRMWKFRTMTADAEARLTEVVNLNELVDPMFKLRADPRVTQLGRILRRTSLDELPQLFNVWRGHMTLVGPRPEQLELVERYAPEHRFRLAVKPGLTGPMQVYGRGELSFEERLAVEREYVENLSLRRDLRILMLTLAAVFRGRGAY
jgi:exopolysaccharide biosynthesis polyprenyl glycosylphosphotransferase